MRIIAISGSPRSGNCERLIREAVEGARSHGAEVEIVLLRNLKFRGCCGRDQCYYEHICPFNDDIKPIMKKIAECDGIILASPSYFNNVSGLMKNFMDRTNPYCKDKKWKGKKVVLIGVGAATPRSVKKGIKAMREFCWIHRLDVVATGCFMTEKPKDANQNAKYLKKARKLGIVLAMAKIRLP
ncbi:MAG: flavodoxin family protein [Candidatus Micrarchaeota archaeon]